MAGRAAPSLPGAGEESNRFGTDEYLELTRQLGADPMIVLPAPDDRPATREHDSPAEVGGPLDKLANTFVNRIMDLLRIGGRAGAAADEAGDHARRPGRSARG